MHRQERERENVARVTNYAGVEEKAENFHLINIVFPPLLSLSLSVDTMSKLKMTCVASTHLMTHDVALKYTLFEVSKFS